jgi:hypothetical protein
MVRKVNKSLQNWVSFIKKVQEEEGLSYKDAMQRAKVRKDSGEKWMVGGEEKPESVMESESKDMSVLPDAEVLDKPMPLVGGRKKTEKRKLKKGGRSQKKGGRTQKKGTRKQ